MVVGGADRAGPPGAGRLLPGLAFEGIGVARRQRRGRPPACPSGRGRGLVVRARAADPGQPSGAHATRCTARVAMPRAAPHCASMLACATPCSSVTASSSSRQRDVIPRRAASARCAPMPRRRRPRDGPAVQQSGSAQAVREPGFDRAHGAGPPELGPLRAAAAAGRIARRAPPTNRDVVRLRSSRQHTGTPGTRRPRR